MSVDRKVRLRPGNGKGQRVPETLSHGDHDDLRPSEDPLFRGRFAVPYKGTYLVCIKESDSQTGVGSRSKTPGTSLLVPDSPSVRSDSLPTQTGTTPGCRTETRVGM